MAQIITPRRAAGFWAAALCLMLGLLAGCPDATIKDMRGSKPTEEKEAPKETVSFERPERPARPPEDFIGSEACQECHAGVCEEFTSHPMSHSMVRTGEDPIEDYGPDTEFKTNPPPRSRNEMSYYATAEDGAVQHHEVLRNPDGEVVYDHAVPVDYSVGSGRRGRSYLFEKDGTIMMSPMTWYSRVGKWDLSPGYEGQNLHFDRRVLDSCLVCHSGRMNPDPVHADQYASPAFLEESIGCEKCHGPGGAHADFHHGVADAADRILNPDDLSTDLQNEVCFQCHLAGESRTLRYGRKEYDFRPGDSTADIWTTFVPVEEEGQPLRVDAVGHGEQMLQSVCYQKSGMMTCTSCHDPHRVPGTEETVAFYRSACVKCHEGDGEQTDCAMERSERLETTEADSCIVCHMPKESAHDVPHVAPTNHRIPRVPRPAGKPPQGEPPLEIHRHDDVSAPEVRRAIAMKIVRGAEQTQGSPELEDAIRTLQEWVRVVPDDTDAWLSLGVAELTREELSKAADAWEAGLKIDPDNEYLLRRLMNLHHDAGDAEGAAKYGAKLLAINPADYEYLGRMSHVLAQTGHPEAAAEAGERALALRPAASQINEWLMQIYEYLGNEERREHHRLQHLQKSR